MQQLRSRTILCRAVAAEQQQCGYLPPYVVVCGKAETLDGLQFTQHQRRGCQLLAPGRDAEHARNIVRRDAMHAGQEAGHRAGRIAARNRRAHCGNHVGRAVCAAWGRDRRLVEHQPLHACAKSAGTQRAERTVGVRDNIDRLCGDRVNAAYDVIVFPFDGIARSVTTQSVATAVHRMDGGVCLQRGSDEPPKAAQRTRAM